jgi:hypothetical protein
VIVDVERASGVTLTQPSPPRAFRGFLLRGALRPATPIEGEGFGTAKFYEVDKVDAITRALASLTPPGSSASSIRSSR